jgi:hypothetical protein
MYMKKEFCVKVVIYKNWTEMRRQQDLKKAHSMFVILIKEFDTCQHCRT